MGDLETTNAFVAHFNRSQFRKFFQQIEKGNDLLFKQRGHGFPPFLSYVILDFTIGPCGTLRKTIFISMV